MGKWDGSGYMNEVNWTEKKLKKGYKIEICFLYPEEVEENRFMWCCRVAERVNTRDDKVIKVDIKWDEQFFACGESEKMRIYWEDICGILAHQGKGSGGKTCENNWGRLSKCNKSFYVSRTINIFSDRKLFKFDNRAVVCKRESIIDIKKSNNATYQNAEQEWTKLLIKKCNLHETNDSSYQMYYIYR